jgi:hypothetical protein
MYRPLFNSIWLSSELREDSADERGTESTLFYFIPIRTALPRLILDSDPGSTGMDQAPDTHGYYLRTLHDTSPMTVT